MIQLLAKNKSFRMLIFSSITAKFGNGITAVLLMYLIGTTAENPFLISLVLFAQLLPMVVIGLLSGSVADRFPRYAVMMGSEWFQTATVFAMMFCLDQPAALIVLIFLQGIGAAFYQPARSAFVTEIVDKEHLAKAIGFSQSVTQAMTIIGPALSGFLLLIFTSKEILILNILTFLLSTAFIYAAARNAQRVQTTAKQSASNETIIQSIKIGIQETFKIAPLRFLLLLIVMVMFCAGIFNANAEVIILQSFKVSAYHYGLLNAAFGVGGILGAMVGPYMINRIKPALFFQSATIFLGVWMIVIYPIYQYGGFLSLALLYVWMAIIGLANTFLNIPVSSLFLATAPDAVRGRAVSILQILSNLGILIGILLGGYLASFVSVITVTAIAGVITIAASFYTMLLKGYKELLAVGRPGVEKKTPKPVAAGEQETVV